MNTDARLTARAIRQPVSTLDNLLQAADELAYQKGQAVLGMVEAWVGPEAFRKGVLEYLAAHEWGNATAADLWGALSKAAGKDVGRPARDLPRPARRAAGHRGGDRRQLACASPSSASRTRGSRSPPRRGRSRCS